MKRSTIRGWSIIHSWASLICTIFLLMLCVTGLPLIFVEEIEHWSSSESAIIEPAPDAAPASLDTLVGKARAQYPGMVPLFVGWLEEGRVVYVNLGATPAAPPAEMKTAQFDAFTGATVDAPQFNEGAMYWIGRIHTDLATGLYGKLFLGVMGVLFALSIISGVVLYRPFMTKLPFGTVRANKSRRAKWLDLHNLLGIVTTGWLVVVALTGIINTLDETLYANWQESEIGRLTEGYRGQPVPASYASLDAAVAAARVVKPGLRPTFISYPGTGYSGTHHYGVFMIGDAPIDQRNFKPVLVDVATAKQTLEPRWPWTLAIMYVTQPLHYGNYGGLPLKILWAVFDIIAIVVLTSGVYLWIARRKAAAPRAIPTDVQVA